MLIFGHRFIPSENFYHISDIDAILKTPPHSTLFLQWNENNLDIITYMRDNNLSFGLEVTTITELLYASSLGAKYIFVPQELAKTAQSIAENYLFDAKIVLFIEDESLLEEMALLGIDGVVFSNAIVKINS
jgi:hypothetical protein